jgi:hypothetical protein
MAVICGGDHDWFVGVWEYALAQLEDYFQQKYPPIKALYIPKN